MEELDMNLKGRITEDMKAAMRARDADRLSSIRMLLAAIQQREVDERIELDDAQVAGVVDKQIKQRRDSISQYEHAQRDDLAARERAEIDVLSAYLPRQATPEQIAAEIDAAISSTGASALKDMGRVMGVIKSRLAGRADLSAVSKQVRDRLAAAGG